MVTFYSALTIAAEAMVTFGLDGSKLGVCLVVVNLAILVLAIWFALDNFRFLRQERARIDRRVSSIIKYEIILFLTCFF